LRQESGELSRGALSLVIDLSQILDESLERRIDRRYLVDAAKRKYARSVKADRVIQRLRRVRAHGDPRRTG
jgi:hypothetical protein